MTPMGRATAVVSAVTAKAEQARNTVRSAEQIAHLVHPVPHPVSVTGADHTVPQLGPRPHQVGGSRNEMSVESQILGATVVAILGSGVMKLLVESMIS
jgi:hypothetical protein